MGTNDRAFLINPCLRHLFVLFNSSATILLQPPPLRIFLIGVCASGKTTLGREAAKQLGIFHISFPEYLQEEILPKMRKPPLVDEDDWEKEQEEREEQKEDEGVL